MGDSITTVEEEHEEDARQRALAMIEYIETQVERGKRIGTDFTEVENLLLGARMMIGSGNYGDAIELINQCSKEAGQRILDHEVLTNTIRKAEMEIKTAEENGKDTTEAKNLLKLARHYQEDGDYRLGLSNAKKSIEALTAKKEVEISWGSGL